MSAGRPDFVQEIIDAMLGWGYIYTARQINNGPWEVAFMGPKTYRGSRQELFSAVGQAWLAARADGVGS